MRLGITSGVRLWLQREGTDAKPDRSKQPIAKRSGVGGGTVTLGTFRQNFVTGVRTKWFRIVWQHLIGHVDMFQRVERYNTTHSTSVKLKVNAMLVK